MFNFGFITLVLVMIPRELDFNSSIAQTITVSAFATPWSLGESKLMQSQLSFAHWIQSQRETLCHE